MRENGRERKEGRSSRRRREKGGRKEGRRRRETRLREGEGGWKKRQEKVAVTSFEILSVQKFNKHVLLIAGVTSH